jgi:hypothetical protein
MPVCVQQTEENSVGVNVSVRGCLSDMSFLVQFGGSCVCSGHCAVFSDKHALSSHSVVRCQ